MITSFDSLVTKSVELGNSFPIMPIDELRLAVAFSELPNQREVIARLVAELFDHENMHVRRIAIGACRRSGIFDVPLLREGLTRRLADTHAWVRYVAAWAILDARFDSEEIRNALIQLSAGVVLPEDEERACKNPSDAELQSRVKAKQALVALLARDA
jgi:hypothetical protein